jgi:hypothetical protein
MPPLVVALILAFSQTRIFLHLFAFVVGSRFKTGLSQNVWIEIRPKIRIWLDPNLNTVQPHDFYAGSAPGRILSLSFKIFYFRNLQQSIVKFWYLQIDRIIIKDKKVPVKCFETATQTREKRVIYTGTLIRHIINPDQANTVLQ